MSILTQAAIQEVFDCHRLIETWFHGNEDATPEVLAALLAKFEPGFSMIAPNGNTMDYDGLARFLSGMRGARPTVKIEVTEPIVIAEDQNHCVLQYEELQYLGGDLLHRISTAVFSTDGNNGANWLRLHETWMPKP